MNQIRKISVGKDYPNGVIHYQINKPIRLNGDQYIISSINLEMLADEPVFNIYIENNMGKVLWKTIKDVPVVLEYNIEFE